ncbi:hypothetical protein D9M72_540000 [compost metagenome]
MGRNVAEAMVASASTQMLDGTTGTSFASTSAMAVRASRIRMPTTSNGCAEPVPRAFSRKPATPVAANAISHVLGVRTTVGSSSIPLTSTVSVPDASSESVNAPPGSAAPVRPARAPTVAPLGTLWRTRRPRSSRPKMRDHIL